MTKRMIPGYLCYNCATRRGGEFPEGHRASAHEAKCPCCSQTAMLLSSTDFRWPKPAAHGETGDAK
jgi:hypothetical protein